MVRRETGVGFQFLRGPLDSDTLKLPLFDWEPERERRRRRTRGVRRLLAWSE